MFREARDSDVRLVELARAGDVQAFERLHERYRPDLLAFCRHLTGQREDAEDAVQYTFFVTYREIAETTRPLDLRPWLFTVARNRCSSLLRRRRARPTARRLEGMGASAEPPPDEIERREELRYLIRDLQALPEQQREALLLSEIADLRHAEIARIIGVSPAKVKALVFQARTSLTNARDARDADCEDIRNQLATLSGGALRRRRLRRHLRECAACSAYEHALAERRRGIAAFVPPAAGSAGGFFGIGSGGAAQAAIAIVAVAGSGVALGGPSSSQADRPAETPPDERVQQHAAAPQSRVVHPVTSHAANPSRPSRRGVRGDSDVVPRTGGGEAGARGVMHGAATAQDSTRPDVVVSSPQPEADGRSSVPETIARRDERTPAVRDTGQGPAARPPGQVRNEERALPPGQVRKQGAEPPPGHTRESAPAAPKPDKVAAPPTEAPAAEPVLPPQSNGNGWGAGGKKSPKPGA